MEQSRAKPEVVMYAGRGWRCLIPFLYFARTLSFHHGFHVLFLTHDKYTPAKMEYIRMVASSCNDAITVAPAVTAKGEQMGSYLNLFPDCGVPICAYIVDSMWTKSPEQASYHINMASGMGIPTYIFCAHSASFLCFALFREKVLQGDLGVNQNGVPGFSSIAVSDLPPALLADQSPAEQIPRASALVGAHGLIINSWYELESAQIDALRSEMQALPPVYPIGPLMPSWSRMPERDQQPATGAAAKFLIRQNSKSVLFISLGSVSLSAEQIRELAVGLEACGHPFLWALKAEARPPSSSSSSYLQSMPGEAQSCTLSELLPEGFENRTKNRGLIISHPPPQGYILAHSCTGGFVSHCDWISTLQSILHCVPIVAWPGFDDEEKLNGLVLVREMKTAIEARKGADGLVSGKEVERCCKALMDREQEGINTRSRSNALRANASISKQQGSSYQAVNSLTTTIKSNMPQLPPL